MSGTIRFHLDENVSSAIADGLRRRGIEVSTTPEEGLIASSDEAQLAFALSQGRVIFTQDDDFLWLRSDRSPVLYTTGHLCKALEYW
jgi:predicted nuclease of predicted toxin-antitoxin system